MKRAVFRSGDPAQSPEGIAMRERLRDPAKREQLRAEQRAQIQSMHPELAEALGDDAETANKLMDLLTDQQMAHLEVVYSEHPDRTNPMNPRELQQFALDMAAAQTRNKQQIEALLGPEQYDRYLEYMETLRERLQVVHYEAQLDPSDKLTADQRARLMQLLHEELAAQMQRRRDQMIAPSRALRGSPSGSQAEREKVQLNENIALNEQAFREMKEDSRLFLERLRGLLTSRQLDAYAQMETRKIEGQRKHVQQMRERAGMSPEFDETPSKVSPPKRTPVAGQVRLRIAIRIDANEPVTADLVTDNGQAATAFELPEGLWAEPTPTLFEDGWANIALAFYEERGGQRRLIKEGWTIGMLTRRPGIPDVPLGSGGGSSSTVSGSRKAYAVSLDARVSPAP